ncbi:MAG: alpha/beta hydrolase [Planctomycetes bacterium]|nr:alpha/beta hydrolase [Planctomycetota bacterium]
MTKTGERFTNGVTEIPLWQDKVPGFDKTIDQQEPSMVPYIVEAGKPYGAVVVCPGGGYNHRAAHEGEPIARWLNSVGISAFVLNYRVSPYRHPIPLGDVKRAIKQVRANSKIWNVDPDHIGVLGFSAGGHLAASAGVLFDEGDKSSKDPVEKASSRPDAMILCYPVITFGEFGHQGSADNLLGAKADKQEREAMSHHLNVGENVPPTFLWHTADDGAVPVENSLMMAMALRAKKIPFELHVFPSGSHGLGLATEHPPVNKWTELCGKWLKGIGF